AMALHPGACAAVIAAVFGTCASLFDEGEKARIARLERCGTCGEGATCNAAIEPPRCQTEASKLGEPCHRRDQVDQEWVTWSFPCAAGSRCGPAVCQTGALGESCDEEEHCRSGLTCR